jgi:hypothetical protein
MKTIVDFRVPSDKVYSPRRNISGRSHATHPNTGFPTSLVKIIQCLRLWSSRICLHSLNVGHANTRHFTHCHKHSCIIEVVTMAAKTAHDSVANRSHRRSLEDSAAEEVASRVIVSVVAIDNHWKFADIVQAWELNCVEFVLPWVK